jgi:uncharacterized membrane protein YhaH (DUF805 family)
MTGRAAAWRSAAVVAVILLLPVAVVAYTHWPGMMSNDTLAQIREVISGNFTNQHAPLLMALWWPWYHLGFGPGWVLGGQLLTFVIGCWLVLRAALAPVAAAIAASLVAFSPPVFGLLGYLSRDVWFTAALIMTFGLTVRALQDRRRRGLWIGLALAAAWLALAARQNAFPSVVLALVVLGGLLLAGRGYAGRRLIVGSLVAGIVVCGALLVTQRVFSAAVGVKDVHPQQYSMIYDLAALSHELRENLFPPDVMPQRGIDVIDERWDRERMNRFVFEDDSPIEFNLAEQPYASLRRAWLDAITDHPLTYLKARAGIQLFQMGIGRRAVWVYQPWIDPNSLGYSIRNVRAHEAAADYVQGFADPNNNGRYPFYLLWLYLLVAAAAGAWLVARGRRSPALLAVGALGLAGLTFQVGLFFGAAAVNYRYQYSVVVSAILCAIVLVAVLRRTTTAKSTEVHA